MAASNIVPISGDEQSRLAAVRRYDLLDTPPDGMFDRVTAIAARLFSVPISIISLVDKDRIWFKSHHGLDVKQIGRDPGLCASAILQADPWILNDAKVDPRSLANPLVAGDFGLRFYVGVPLRTHDGFNLGTLCVIDREPRSVTEEQIANLRDLASTVMDQMELRISAISTVSKLSLALRRSELMAKEIDHRVMNSLQLVSSMLTLQSRGLGDTEASDQLVIAASRIAAIARAHQHIFLGEDVETADSADYLERLCADLSGMLSSQGHENIIVDAIRVELPTVQVGPLGLILHELVTNSAKHGNGQIAVTFKRASSGDYCLSVSDDGAALAADFDPAQARGLGMKVVRSLAGQLRGQLIVDRAEGTRGTTFSVLFPAGAPN
jgi:two-component sensor histidine kinase